VLDTPRFHHLHLNSVDPERAISFYARQFPSTSPTTWGGLPALASYRDVLILFTRVDAPPPTAPEAPDTAIWHFGWHVPDPRERLRTYQSDGDLKLLPLYTGDDDGWVLVSSDTWPGAGGTLGRTRAEVAEAKASGVQPRRTAGFAYLQGPDSAIVEYAGNYPTERFNHVHMWQDEPLVAQRWYQQHLQATLLPAGAELEAQANDSGHVARCADRSFPSLQPEGMYRIPSGGVAFDDLWLPWYMRQGEMPLAPTRGQLYDHIALGVSDLDAWIDKLKREQVAFLQEEYALGDTRAVMIDGPSHEAIELLEIRNPSAAA
jgi:catechol 2,3-dioxygenase-like lactoylglutathione lyase family enzyme